MKVLIVYPGIVDTELFSIPDNDPLDVPVEPITVDECVGMILDAFDRDALEVYTPAHFKDYAVGKANNVEGFLAGTAEYARQQRIQILSHEEAPPCAHCSTESSRRESRNPTPTTRWSPRSRAHRWTWSRCPTRTSSSPTG